MFFDEMRLKRSRATSSLRSDRRKKVELTTKKSKITTKEIFAISSRQREKDETANPKPPSSLEMKFVTFKFPFTHPNSDSQQFDYSKLVK